MNRAQLNQMAMVNAVKEQEAFDKAIIGLIEENEMLKRQLNLMNINQQKKGKQNEGRNAPVPNNEKVKIIPNPKYTDGNGENWVVIKWGDKKVMGYICK